MRRNRRRATSRTDYLLKVFDYDAQARRFVEAPLENQIDRDRLLADRELRRAFRDWLLDTGHFSELDRGTLVIPERFLARHAIAPTPAGFDVTELLPEFGLVQREGAEADPTFAEQDVIAALQKAAREGVELHNIRSVAGFERRLNDVTCAGCHQTRGIGGFHFPGVDWMAEKTVQFDGRAGVAALLRRPAAPPRHSRGVRAGTAARLLARIRQPSATRAKCRACRHRI